MKNLKFLPNLKSLIKIILKKMMNCKNVRGNRKSIYKFANIIERSKPDIILSGFDVAANFALSFMWRLMNIPVAHIQGGEVSGTIDESLRHAMSKFSNFHLQLQKRQKKIN